MTNPSPEQPPKSNIERYVKPKTVIRWVNGLPIPYTDFVFDKNKIPELMSAVAALEYRGCYDPVKDDIIVDPYYSGLSNVEAMFLQLQEKAARGDMEATKIILDRMLGKPKQHIEAINCNMTLGEYLGQLDLEEKAKEWQQKVLDVTPESE